MKVWFITGTSRGFGHAWTRAALARGDAVAAASLDVDEIHGLADEYGDRVLPMQLDVRERDACFSAVRTAADHFGHLDVVVNNAGYGYLGMVEEFTEADVRTQIDTNFLGAMWVTQAALPILRAGGGGRIIQVSSMGGLIAYPTFGAYNASKWALEGMSQALAGEVSQFGIKVTLIEPVGYATDWWGDSMRHTVPLPEYAELRAGVEANWKAAAPSRAAPEATVDALFSVVDAEDPPLRVLFGDGALERLEEEYARRLEEWNDWQDVSVTAV